MEHVFLQRLQHAVLTISFNRPEARNAWNRDPEDALRDALVG